MENGFKRRAILHTAAFYVGVTKSGFAGGTGMIVTPLMAMTLSAREALALALPLLWLSDIVNFGLFWGAWNLQAVGYLLPSAIVGILGATKFVSRLPEYRLKRFIGGFALTFVPIQILRMTLWREFDPASWGIAATIGLGIAAGLAMGVFTTMAHVGGLISTIYFLFVLPKENINAALVGTSTVLYFALNSVKIVTYARSGIMSKSTWKRVPVLIPALGAGLLAGKGINRFLSGDRVDWFVYVALLLVAAMGWKLLTTAAPAGSPPNG